MSRRNKQPGYFRIHVIERIKNIIRQHDRMFIIAKMIKWSCRFGIRKAFGIFHHIENAILWPDEAEIKREQAVVFPQKILFSIITPLYNTGEKHLREMIESVQGQTYFNWELCLADGSDEAHSYVGSVCKEYSNRDSRVKYLRLSKNAGISGNSNACIEMATGDYLALLDHDDVLHPSALFEVMRAICDRGADFIYSDENIFHHVPTTSYFPRFKPDYAPDTLRSNNYICHFTVFSAALLSEAGGGFRSEYDGSQDYDIILRLTEKAKSIVHIPKVLYYWRSHPQSTAADLSVKPYAVEAGKRALDDHLRRIGCPGRAENAQYAATYRINYEIPKESKVSILIPCIDHIGDLKRCLDSIMDKTTYPSWEVVVIVNSSAETAAFEYCRQIQRDDRIRVVNYPEEGFNYPAIYNYGAKYAEGEYLLLLNSNTRVISSDWIEQMVMFAQRQDVGAVGSMLYNEDDTIQHAGMILGYNGLADNREQKVITAGLGYTVTDTVPQNFSAVSGVGMMIPRRVWDGLNGMDEAFEGALYDVDICMRIRKAGYLIAWTPYAELYHHTSINRSNRNSREKQMSFPRETDLFKERWKQELAEGDPYFNPNLDLYL